MRLKIYIFCCISIWLFEVITADPITFEKSNELWREEDRIRSLPGVRKMPDFPMYSGYLNPNASDHLFYWLVNATDPQSKKLIVWFNGGPGCSSLDGFFYENGPFMFHKHSDTLEANPHSWNTIGHVLYIESPIGTGFSYTDDNTSERYVDDDQTAEMNFNALKDFFRRFPHFASMELYITGESYAGVYIPTLAVKIAESNGVIARNLKGLYIGNGLMHKKLNSDTLVEYGYYHGFIGPKLWNQIQKFCCKNKNKKDCSYNNFVEDDCMEKVSEYKHAIYSEGLNIYNFADDCAFKPENIYENGRFYGWHTSEEGAHRLYLQPVCSDASALTNYLNRPEVRNAIHARQVQESDGKWELCSTTLFFAYNQLYDNLSDSINIILRRMPNVKILLYYGDFDLACNFLGGEKFVDQLGLEMTVSRRKWTVERNGHAQIAGFYKEYGNLMYATVKAAGHMVPTDKPVEILSLIHSLMNDLPI